MSEVLCATCGFDHKKTGNKCPLEMTNKPEEEMTDMLPDMEHRLNLTLQDPLDSDDYKLRAEFRWAFMEIQKLRPLLEEAVEVFKESYVPKEAFGDDKAPECYEHFYKNFFTNWEKNRNEFLTKLQQAGFGKEVEG